MTTTPQSPDRNAAADRIEVENVAANIWAGMVQQGYTFGGDDFADIHDEDKERLRAIASDVIAALRAGGEPVAWMDGEPPKWFDESFIALLDNSEREVLRRLPEDWTYDYTTNDGTYYMARRLRRWMQFPDSQYKPFAPSPAAALPEREASALAWMRGTAASLGVAADTDGLLTLSRALTDWIDTARRLPERADPCPRCGADRPGHGLRVCCAAGAAGDWPNGDTAPPAPGVVSEAMVRDVARHIDVTVKMIERNWPNAAMLDRGPIMRNLRAWADKLTAALNAPPAAQPERAGGGERRVLLADHPASRHALLTAALNTPPAPAGDAVAGLVGKWLDKAADELVEGRLNDAQGYSHIGREHHLAAKWLDWCARELAATLQSSGREGMVNAPPAADGMVLVPRKPTQAMLDAGYHAIQSSRDARSVFSAMLAAAPRQDGAEGVG